MPESLFDKFPLPPCAKLLGWTLIDLDAERGWIKVGFDARAEFLNFGGTIQGGFLTAMLDDTMGPAIVIKSGGTLTAPTIDLHVHFLSPAKVGRLVCEAQVIQLGRTVAFIEGKLSDAQGVEIARATASGRVVSLAA